METSNEQVTVWTRGDACIVTRLHPPFLSSYWPNADVFRALYPEAKVIEGDAEAFESKAKMSAALRGRYFLEGLPGASDVRLGAGVEEEKQRDMCRESRLVLTFLGCRSRQVTMGALEAACQRVRRGGVIEIKFRDSDLLAGGTSLREEIKDIVHALQIIRGRQASIMIYSGLQEVQAEFWTFLYDVRHARVTWVASELQLCGDMQDYRRFTNGSVGFRNLVELCRTGVWPDIVVPITSKNVSLIPQLVPTILDATRGACIRLEPFISAGQSAESPPGVDVFCEAIVDIYRDHRIPLRLVHPLSWVTERIDSQSMLLPSPATIGAELAVLPNGDVYAGELAVGLNRWYLGNVANTGGLRWERLDFMAEAFSKTNMPSACQSCDWRYRCGGVDGSLFLIEEKRQLNLQAGQSRAAVARGLGVAASQPPTSEEGTLLAQASVCAAIPSEQEGLLAPASFALYCQPRRRLFEEMLWGSVENAVAVQTNARRERIELGKDKIEFVPAGAANSANGHERSAPEPGMAARSGKNPPSVT